MLSIRIKSMGHNWYYGELNVVSRFLNTIRDLGRHIIYAVTSSLGMAFEWQRSVQSTYILLYASNQSRIAILDADRLIVYYITPHLIWLFFDKHPCEVRVTTTIHTKLNQPISNCNFRCRA